MRFRFSLVCASILAIIPALAVAKEMSAWDFRNSQIPGSWEVSKNLSIERSVNGLVIRANEAGAFIRSIERPLPDVLTFIAIAPKDTEVILSWHMEGDLPNNLVQLPFTIPGGSAPAEIPVPVRQFPEWKNADRVGLALKPTDAITIQEIRLERWSTVEKAIEAWKTFWTFDSVTAYTINFLWGPLLTFTPLERETLFYNSPPQAMSANRVFYAVLLLAAVAALCLWFAGLPGKRLFFIVFAAVWIVMDMRMGLEFLSYVRTDYGTWLSRPSGAREFRNYLNFHDVVEQSLPELTSAPRYMFIGPIENLLSYVRYRTYPSVPVFAEQNPAGTKVWLIFRRPDFSVNGSGTLLHGAEPAVSGGSVVKRFDPESFLYIIP